MLVLVFWERSFEMRKFLSNWAFAFLGALIVVCCSCETNREATSEPVLKATVSDSQTTAAKPADAEPVDAKPVDAEPADAEPADAKPADAKPADAKPVEEPNEKETEPKAAFDPSTVVARISDYEFTRGELQGKVSQALARAGDPKNKTVKPTDAKSVLLEMVAEKAMILDAKEMGLLDDESTQASLKTKWQNTLIGMLFRTELSKRIKISESEVEAVLKAKPELTRQQAESMVQKKQGGKLVNEYFVELGNKFKARKLSENFPKTIQIYKRLLYAPRKGMRFIKKKQVMALEDAEKNIVLAQFDGEKVTLKDWFFTLCEIVPTSRPRDLNTARGVEKLLDRSMRRPIFTREANLRGLDKDATVLKDFRKEADPIALSKARRMVYQRVAAPTPEELPDYFEKNKDKFAKPAEIKMDQIWFADLDSARNAKTDLDKGMDFESMRQKYSSQKEARAVTNNAWREGKYFQDLWAGEVNEIVGPVKGMRSKGLEEWRIVKIMKKTPMQMKEYSEKLEKAVAGRMKGDRRQAVLADYRKELLEKYSYEIYEDKIAGIDPADVP